MVGYACTKGTLLRVRCEASEQLRGRGIGSEDGSIGNNVC